MLGGRLRRGHAQVGLAAKKRARECSRWALSSSWMGRAGGVAGWGGSSVAGELGRDRVKTVWSRRLLAGSPAAVAGLEDVLGSWKEWETCQWKRVAGKKAWTKGAEDTVVCAGFGHGIQRNGKLGSLGQEAKRLTWASSPRSLST